MIQYTTQTQVIFQIFNNQCITGIILSEQGTNQRDQDISHIQPITTILIPTG